MRKTILLTVMAFFSAMAYAQDYSNAIVQGDRLQAIAKNYAQFASLRSLGKTAGGHDIWLLTIGTGKTETKPAIAVIGGVDGNHLLGMELAIGFAENLLKGSASDSVQKLLSRTTFYVFPNMSPDAMDQYFAKIKYERTGNGTATDDDRDGKINEDGVDDLDGNGKITMMRVESPVGDYRLHPDDARILIKADPSKGEKGRYLLLQEGIDNDRDKQLNEDGEGGIAINKNLTYKHNTFAAGAGDFPASEKETRAMLDFLFDAFNVYAVVSFGSNNNLSTPVAYNPATARERIVSGYQEADAKVNSMVSELYNKVTGLKDAPKTTPAGGDVLSWGYFHYTRYSFSTPGWWVPKAKPDTAKKEKAFSVDDAGANYLRWAQQQGITNTFTEWKTVQHPDYPAQKVEVGGIDPFVLQNPPYRMVPDLVKKHTDFLVKLAAQQPTIETANLKTEKLGNGLTRVSVDVMNTGGLSTHSKLGERSYFLKKMKIALKTDRQEVVGGRKVILLSSLESGATQTFSWLVKGSGKVSIEAGCPTAGTQTVEVTL